MRFVYNNKNYEVLEMWDGGTSFDGCVVLFEIQYASYNAREQRTIRSEEEYLEQEDIIFEEKRFVNYFPISSRDPQSIIESCKYFIDHEYDKRFDTLKYLLKQLKLCIVEFEKDFEENNNTKGSLDRLEYAQSDLLDWVKENVEIDTLD